MTDKQKYIIESALTLFSENGYSAVSTSLIAKHANVSEGLIFRHFMDKFGLLNHLVDDWYDKFESHISTIRSIEKPEQRIQAVMELPFRIDELEFPYWRLVFSISKYILTLRDMLELDLNELKYADVTSEAELIIAYFDGFMSTVLLRNDVSLKINLLDTLMKKYL
jgi:AcrR family transcriptional regulator